MNTTSNSCHQNMHKSFYASFGGMHLYMKSYKIIKLCKNQSEYFSVNKHMKAKSNFMPLKYAFLFKFNKTLKLCSTDNKAI